MKIANCCSVLFVRDVKASKEFYCGLLGCVIDLDFGKNVIFRNGFATWEIQDHHIIPGKLGRENISDTSVSRFELYFETEDLDGANRHLQEHGVIFLHGIHEEPWGQRTIRFFDPDNHIIEIGESMKQFVKRFHDEGMTVAAIRQRTSVPEEEIQRLLGLEST